MKKFKRFTAALIAVTIVICMVGCGGSKKKSEQETVRWYMPITPLPDTTEVHKVAQDYILEKTGIKTEFLPISMGEYEQKLQVINASREEYDLMFTSSWMNFYNMNVERGSLLDITELLPKYAPNTYKNVPEHFWDATKVDGKIYGVINQQIMSRAPSLLIPAANKKYVDLDYSKFSTLHEALDAYLEAAYKKTGTYTYCDAGWSNMVIGYGYEEILGSLLPPVIKYKEDGAIKVLNQYETPEFLEYLQYKKKWVDKGWAQPNEEIKFDYTIFRNSNPADAYIPDIMVTPTYKPGLESEYELSHDMKVESEMIMPGLVSAYSVLSTLTGVSATSSDPKSAIKVVELMNTDKYLYNTIAKGIEGKHFTKIDDNTIELNEDNKYVIQEWAVGSVFNSYITKDYPENVWEETDKFNRESFTSPLLGFNFDLEPIKVEQQNCNSVASEYLPMLESGRGDIDALYKEFMNKLDAAGIDKLIEECQRQIDEWQKNKK